MAPLPRLLLAAAALTVAACEPDKRMGVLTGVITDGPDVESATIDGARVRTFNKSGKQLDDVTSNGDGAFQAATPWGGTFFIEVDDGDVPTAFSAIAQYGSVEGGPGDLWARSQGELDGLRATYDQCPTVDDAGGVIEGEVRVYLPVNELDDLPEITTAVVTATGADGTVYDACYLNDLTQSEPDLPWTGETGRFAIFGVKPGIVDIDIDYWVPNSTGEIDTSNTDTLVETPTLPIRMPENGASPHYPLWANAPAEG